MKRASCSTSTITSKCPLAARKSRRFSIDFSTAGPERSTVSVPNGFPNPGIRSFTQPTKKKPVTTRTPSTMRPVGKRR
jgi:hypothetical protein